MSNDTPADERLANVAEKLISHGLHVNMPVNNPCRPATKTPISYGSAIPRPGNTRKSVTSVPDPAPEMPSLK
jgi:hypothetical protein